MACLFGHQWNGCKCEKCGKTRDVNHPWDGCKCTVCGATRNMEHAWQNGICSRCGAVWTPTNPRLASNMPLSSLHKIFVFTSGGGKNVLGDPAAAGTLADTVGRPFEELTDMSFDVVEQSNVGSLIQQTGQFPEIAWTAMSGIDATATLLAQTGLYKMCVRTFRTIRGESGAFVLLYKK